MTSLIWFSSLFSQGETANVFLSLQYYLDESVFSVWSNLGLWSKWFSAVPLWLSGLRIHHYHCSGSCCCCSTGSIPGPGTSICHKCSQKEKNKNKSLLFLNFYLVSEFFLWWDQESFRVIILWLSHTKWWSINFQRVKAKIYNVK